jgi:PAS domain S-box-containing protein
MKKLLLLLFSFTFIFEVHSQQTPIDSLTQLLKTIKGEKKALILVQLQKKLVRKNSAQSIKYGNLAIEEATKANLPLITLQALNLIGKTYIITAKYDSADYTLHNELELAQKLKNQKEIGLALHSLGNSALYQEKREDALELYQKALSIREKIQDTVGISASVNNIGKIYYDLRNFDFALIYFEKSLKYDELLNDKASLGVSYNNVGLIYLEKKNYEKALEYLNKSKNIRTEIGDIAGLYSSLNNIGLVYSRLKKYEEAIINYQESYKLSHEAGNEWDEANTLENIGDIYVKTKQFKDALTYLDMGFDIAKRNNFKQLLRDSYKRFAEYYEVIGDYKKGFDNLKYYVLIKDSIVNENMQNQILEMQTKYETEKKEKDILKKDLEIKEKSSKIQSQQYFLWSFILGFLLISVFFILIYKQFRAKKKAYILLENQNTEIKLKNAEIINQKEEIIAQSEQLEQVNVELEKLSIVARETDNAVVIFDKNLELEWVNNGFTKIYGYAHNEFVEKYGKSIHSASTNQAVRELIDESISTKKSVFYNSATKSKAGEDLWLQTTLTPIFSTNGGLHKLISVETDITTVKKAEQRILEQNEMIKSGIRYAKTIQNAVLPPHEYMDSLYENFIIYRPKDIVSGDFYWISQIKTNETEKNIIAVVDCTGHGVPGALMSMIGIQLLNEIVHVNHLFSPCEILEKLDEKVKTAMHQYDNDMGEGMDVCLCTIENSAENQVEIVYSGAKRPLIYDAKTNDSIKTLPGERRSVGGHKQRNGIQPAAFTNQKLLLQKGDVVYLSSDGFTDQNNAQREKFGTPRLLETISRNRNIPLREAEKLTLASYEAFVDNQAQRDDITLLAVKV